MIPGTPLVKQPTERRRYGIDFVNLLSTGDGISTGSTEPNAGRVRVRPVGSTVLVGGTTLTSTATSTSNDHGMNGGHR